MMLHNKWQAARSVIADEMRLAFGAWPEGRRRKGGREEREKKTLRCVQIHFRNHRRESWWMPTWMIVVDLGGWYVRDMLSTIDMVVAPTPKKSLVVCYY